MIDKKLLVLFLQIKNLVFQKVLILVVDKNAKLPNPKLGHVSSSCWSVENNNPFSLAIVKDGKNMIGKKLFAVSPLKNTAIEVEVISSHYVDHEGKRVRS